ncbi:HD domain-containing protein [Candidatus Dojkabacteria bacterium]|nr:HD domain-containing protein [Candidatus Dojkabacteria bacterium]
MSLPSRDEAQKLLAEHVQDQYQLYHSRMVALAMEAYAEKYGEDKDKWYITGLLHDLDYFEFPQEHPKKSLEWFKEWGYPEDVIHAVRAHAMDYNGLEKIEPQNKLAAALIACDELSGLLHAYSLMRPGGYEGMEVSSVKKKFKDKFFAAKINRSDIDFGIEKLGVEFTDHVQLLIETFQSKLK